jgi:hypothetical protein
LRIGQAFFFTPLDIYFGFLIAIYDGFVKSPFCPIFVIPESGDPGFPVKTGIQIHIFLSALGGLLSQE